MPTVQTPSPGFVPIVRVKCELEIIADVIPADFKTSIACADAQPSAAEFKVILDSAGI